MWFIFALITVFAWGGSDLFSKLGTDPHDKYSHWHLIIIVGFAMGLHAIGYILITGYDYPLFSIVQYLPVSLMYILSMAFGYVGLRYIRLSVSSPICNSSGAVSALLCFLLLGATMTGIQFVAVAMISVGIFLLAYQEKRYDDQLSLAQGETRDPKYTMSFLAILFPILYCLIDGIGITMDVYWLDAIMVDEDAANLSYEFTFFIAAILALIYMLAIRKQKFSFKKDKFFGVAAICETAGQFTYIRAIASDEAIVAIPMISAYCVMSVLLSRIFLKEKLKLPQYLVIALVVGGIIILGVAEAMSEMG